MPFHTSIRCFVLSATISAAVFFPLAKRADAQFSGARQQADQIRDALEGTKPEEGRKPPTKSGDEKVALFDGTDLEGWTTREEEAQAHWKVVGKVVLDPKDGKKLVGTGKPGTKDAAMFLAEPTHGADICSARSFGDVEVHVDFLVGKEGNSGVYLMGQYEVQIFDSFGKKKEDLTPADVGGIYATHAPSQNAAKPAGVWQTLDIVFRTPRFDKDQKKTENARFISVKLNGTLIQKDIEAKAPTGSQLPGGEKSQGPLMLQGDHGPIAFRNIWVKSLK